MAGSAALVPLWHEIKGAAKYGITVGDVKLDLDGMMKQKDEAVTGLTTGIEGLLKKNKASPAWQATFSASAWPRPHACPTSLHHALQLLT